jgi:hypothetical protein
VKLARDKVKVTVGSTMVTCTGVGGSWRLPLGGTAGVGGFHPLIAPFRVALETMVPFICRTRSYLRPGLSPRRGMVAERAPFLILAA